MSAKTPYSVPFHYWEDTSASWPGRLAGLKQEGVDEIHTFIPWGLHETVQGIRDFSKSPKLRLEKFLSLAHEAGLTVRATLGFPARREALPHWSMNLGQNSSLVAAAVWKAGADDLSVTRLPCLHDEHFFGPFLEFVSDVFSLLSLYRFPEGPLVGVTVDWGVYAQDLAASTVPIFASFLQERYPQAGLINIRYHCTFRDFATAASAQGTRVLLEKRPWLAAYDYKFCRERMLEERAQGVLALQSGEPLVDLLSFASGVSHAAPPSDAAWAVVMDPVLLEGDVQGQASLFAPLGHVNVQATNAFRLWEYLRAHSEKSAVPLLPLLQDAQSPAPTITAIAGRFLAQALVRTVRNWIDEGTTVYFPFGLPQYDENLATIDWKLGPGRKAQIAATGGAARIALGKGWLCFNEAPTNPAPQFWTELEKFSRTHQEGVSP